MNRIVQSKGASGATQSVATFSADSGGRWEILYVKALSDLTSATLLFKQGNVTVGTVTVGTTANFSMGNGSGPIFVGADEGAVSVTLSSTSAGEVLATARQVEIGQS
jgi:hypothetical protein